MPAETDVFLGGRRQLLGDGGEVSYPSKAVH